MVTAQPCSPADAYVQRYPCSCSYETGNLVYVLTSNKVVWEIPARFGVTPGKLLKHSENRHFIYIRLGSGWIKTNSEYHYNLLKCCCQRQPDRSTPQSQDKQDI